MRLDLQPQAQPQLQAQPPQDQMQQPEQQPEQPQPPEQPQLQNQPQQGVSRSQSYRSQDIPITDKVVVTPKTREIDIDWMQTFCVEL